MEGPPLFICFIPENDFSQSQARFSAVVIFQRNHESVMISDEHKQFGFSFESQLQKQKILSAWNHCIASTKIKMGENEATHSFITKFSPKLIF